MKNSLTLGDGIVIAVLFFATLLSAFVLLAFRSDAQQVRISTEEETIVYDLLESRNLEIVSRGVHLVVHISPNGVFVKTSDCENQICVNSRKIVRGGEVIVCAPAGVRIEMISGKAADYVVG